MKLSIANMTHIENFQKIIFWLIFLQQKVGICQGFRRELFSFFSNSLLSRTTALDSVIKLSNRGLVPVGSYSMELSSFSLMDPTSVGQKFGKKNCSSSPIQKSISLQNSQLDFSHCQILLQQLNLYQIMLC